MKLRLSPETFSIARLEPTSELPKWALASSFYSISKTPDELSIVCEEKLIPKNVKSEQGWKMLRVEGTLDFGLTGILASIANPLAKAKISIFAISTFDTDYILVREKDLKSAESTLQAAGFELS